MNSSPTKIYLKQPDNTFKQFGDEVTGIEKNHFEVITKYPVILNKPDDIFTIMAEEPDGSTEVFEMYLVSYVYSFSSVYPAIYHKVEFEIIGETK